MRGVSRVLWPLSAFLSACYRPRPAPVQIPACTSRYSRARAVCRRESAAGLALRPPSFAPTVLASLFRVACAAWAGAPAPRASGRTRARRRSRALHVATKGVGRREGGGRARRAHAAVEVSTAVALIDYGRRSRALRSVCWPRAVGAPHLPVAALLWQAERARKSPALPGLAAAMRAQSDTDRGRGTRAEGGLDSETLSGTDGCRLAR